jgi:hypothetical protein
MNEALKRSYSTSQLRTYSAGKSYADITSNRIWPTWKNCERQDHHYVLCVVHFVYILMDPDPTWKPCHQHIRLATNMKFAGVNINSMVTQAFDATISMGWPPIIFSILNWREIDNFIDFLQNKSQSVYDKRKQLWKNVCIKIIWQSHHTHYHFNTTSDKIHMTNKSALWNIPFKGIFQSEREYFKVHFYLTPTLMNMQWWSCLVNHELQGAAILQSCDHK